MNRKDVLQGMAAFMGAAAVFVFTLILKWIDQFRQRRLRHYNESDSSANNTSQAQ